MLRIKKIVQNQEGAGCVVDALADKVRYRVRSDFAEPCSWIEAGKTYEAARAVVSLKYPDDAEDYAVLIIFSDVKNRNGAFTIESEDSL